RYYEILNSTGVTTLFVSALALDPTNTRTVYAGTGRGTQRVFGAPGALLKSTDGGDTWGPADTGMPGADPNFAVYSLAVDPTNPSIVYAGTDSGVFKTTDGGASWSPTGVTLPAFALVLDP